MEERKVKLSFNDGTPGIELPIMSGTLGPDVIDIRALAQTGKFTFDPGFLATASCSSEITFIDGDAGLLYYRGYPIEQIAEHSDFVEACYLLLYGELPTAKQKEMFAGKICRHNVVHDELARFCSGFPRSAHPMAIMGGVVGALSAFYHESIDVTDPAHRQRSALLLLAKAPAIAAMAYKYSIGQPFVCPQDSFSYVENFLYMMFGTPTQEYVPNAKLVRAMERILILHADHEQNASTSTVRLAGSSGANPFACVAAGIASLWGPAHGGANEAVLKMLEEIGDVSQISKFITRAKNKKNNYRLMGFGHRVYKHLDPRADVMRKACHEVLKELGLHDDKLFKIALELERIALEDEYFVKKKLYPNVDFYSGIILRALGIPVNMFTVIFALARTVGWVSQWNEMMADPEHKIGRPRQLYCGAAKRDYVPMKERG